jgi:hypothetical protein
MAMNNPRHPAEIVGWTRLPIPAELNSPAFVTYFTQTAWNLPFLVLMPATNPPTNPLSIQGLSAIARHSLVKLLPQPLTRSSSYS